MERPIKLLIVDDERQIRESYGDFFAKRGFDVELASDGEQGLNMLREGEFDVAILDIRMPKMDGLALAEAVSNEGIDTSLVILTGYGEQQDAIKAFNKGIIQGWFEKARIDTDELLQQVQKLAQVVSLDDVRRILSAIPVEERPT
jgi:DNA-binding NtrC family response regulator